MLEIHIIIFIYTW